MMKFKKCKLFAVLLASTLFICACTAKENIPELQEPVGSAPSYRPLEKIDMGEAKIILGTVSGTDYCHYFEKSNVAIKEIKVYVGQYVEKGDILAEADTDATKEMVSSLNSQLSLLNEQNALDEKVHELTMKRLEIEKEEAEYNKNLGIGSETLVTLAQNNIDKENENFEYNRKLYEFNKRKLNESITDYNKIVNDGVIKAKSSGIVTYVKDLKNGTTAASYENI
nr:efflux RND transporter periplasmic adaptor subunit [Lachnospiraceae bacterium]